MASYENLLGRLHYSNKLCMCATGKLTVPLESYRSPAEWYVYPPALIPVLSDGSGPTYLGIWRHWFSRRSSSFVKVYVERNRYAVEVALTEQQFFDYLALLAICEADGHSEPLEKFANAIGHLDLEAIDAVSLITGDDPTGLCELPSYVASCPAVCAPPATYQGSFPVGRRNIETACSFEFGSDDLQAIRSDPAAPIWLRTTNQPATFDNLLASGDLQGAWLSLNSTGWTLGEACQAIERLCQLASDEEFNELAQVWLESANAPFVRLDRY